MKFKAIGFQLAAGVLRAIYFFIKIMSRRRDRIVLICCEDDEPTQDIRDLAEALRAQGAEVLVRAGRMRRNPAGALAFIGEMLGQMRAIASARVCAIDAYAASVSLLRHRAGTRFVQLWHAPEAIKKFSLQIVGTPAGQRPETARALHMHEGYDAILCPSDATRPFFEEAFGYPASAFVKLGLPALDRISALRDCGGGSARAELLAQYPALAGRKVVVYAPTFRDGRPVDAAGLANALKAEAGRLPGARAALVLKLHPLDAARDEIETFLRNTQDTRDTAEAGEAGPFVLCSDDEFPTLRWYALADAVVTDYSGVIVEAAAFGTAVYGYLYDADRYAAERGLNVDLRCEAIGPYCFKEAAALSAQALRDLYEGTYDFARLRAFRDKYLEVPLSGNTEHLAAWLLSLI